MPGRGMLEQVGKGSTACPAKPPVLPSGRGTLSAGPAAGTAQQPGTLFGRGTPFAGPDASAAQRPGYSVCRTYRQCRPDKG
eukprot:363442-Chlamydomonas_euryale.AAC.2